MRKMLVLFMIFSATLEQLEKSLENWDRESEARDQKEQPCVK